MDGSAGTPAVIGSDADTGFVFAAGQITASLNGAGANVPLVQGTAQNSTSGTAIDFTGIPSWAKRITVLFNGVSLSATADILVQLGTSGGVDATSYAATSSVITSVVTTSSSTAGFIVVAAAAAAVQSGTMVIANVSGNIWVASHATGRTDSAGTRSGGGVKTLSGTLDRVRITSTSTDTFDAGSINIFYE